MEASPDSRPTVGLHVIVITDCSVCYQYYVPYTTANPVVILYFYNTGGHHQIAG